MTDPTLLNELKTIEEKLEPLIGLIRGLCRIYTDIIVAKKLKLPLDQKFLDLQAETLKKEEKYEQDNKDYLESYGFDLETRKKVYIG